MNRMDRSTKSLTGGLLILIASVLAAVEQNRVTPIVYALIVVGVWMAVSAAIAESFWDAQREKEDEAERGAYDLSDLPMQLVELGRRLNYLMPQSRGCSISVKADPEAPHADVVITLHTTASVDEVSKAEPNITTTVVDHQLSQDGLSIVCSFDFMVNPQATEVKP